jgi:hypothetical protein
VTIRIILEGALNPDGPSAPPHEVVVADDPRGDVFTFSEAHRQLGAAQEAHAASAGGQVTPVVDSPPAEPAAPATDAATPTS